MLQLDLRERLKYNLEILQVHILNLIMIVIASGSSVSVKSIGDKGQPLSCTSPSVNTVDCILLTFEKADSLWYPASKAIRNVSPMF